MPAMINLKRQRLYLVLVLLVVAFSIGFVSIFFLYRTALEEEKARLVEAAQSQARLMEAVARFDAVYSHNYPEGTEAATLSQFIDAHKRFKGFGRTGEFLLGKAEDDRIVFVLSHRHSTLTLPQPLPLDSDRVIPMRRALMGESGVMEAFDYRGEQVLAAFEPIRTLNLGLVAKIDLKEIRAPFYQAALTSLVVGLGVAFLGILLFLRFSEPMVAEIARSRQQLRDLIGRLQAVREEEKSRIARDIHDELGQLLTALKLDLTCLKEDLEKENHPHAPDVSSLVDLVEATIESVQNVASELHPPILDMFGLGEAIRMHTAEFLNHTDIEFDLKGVDDSIELDPDRSTALFRVFQETLTNISRHSRATQARVKLCRRNGEVMLEVTDNGVGISEADMKSMRSLGLLGMRERARLWGGTFEIQGRPEGGTRVTVSLPVNGT